MKLAVLGGRAVLWGDAGYLDVAEASDDRFRLANVFDDWSSFRQWARETKAPRKPLPAAPSFDAPMPLPRQVFGIGVNYRSHADEAGIVVPADPLVFTKFPTCIAGEAQPLQARVPLDWEVELVVVIGRTARNVSRDEAWSHVAGLTIGQDISDRTMQFQGSHPQFSLCKSGPGYGPVGPWLVTPDALANRDDLAISCTIDGEALQSSRTSQLIHDVPGLVRYLSTVVTLLPGDVIFTGTPAGVGFSRKPPRFLQPGETLVSAIEGIGELRTKIVSAS